MTAIDEHPAMVGQAAGRALRILLADDHPLVCQAIGEVAASVAPGTRVQSLGSLAALMNALAADPDADLVLLDLHLPDCSGFAGLRRVRDGFPAIPVAIITALRDQPMIDRAMALGASAFIPKSTPLPDIRAAIAAVLDGEIWLPARQPAAAATDALLADLTPAQLKIVSCLERGLLNKQIAFEIGVTEFTVKAHMTAAFRKLGVSNRTQAIMVLKQRRQAD